MNMTPSAARLSIAAVCTYQLLLATLVINVGLARNDQVSTAARRVLLSSAGLPLAGLVAFFVMLATIVPAEGWPPRFLAYEAAALRTASLPRQRYLLGRAARLNAVC